MKILLNDIVVNFSFELHLLLFLTKGVIKLTNSDFEDLLVPVSPVS